MKYNGVVVKMDRPGDYSYQIINNKGITIATQDSNVFNRLAPGDYFAKVTNKEGVESSKPFTLPEIAVDNITLTKAQKIFDKLSKTVV